MELHNPILPGFYPDPSICRAGDDFYLVTSSFSYYPGVPLFHSRDLVHWEQIGHVLDRPSQLPLDHHGISGGIFAPTIRYHDGMFYMITTNVNHGGNFIVTATDPAGDWSDPIWIEGAEGIDPTIFFDDDGRVYYVGTSGFSTDIPHIWLGELDPKTLQLKGEKYELWRGALTDCRAPEAPHLYKKNGWYYLMIAEGGTEHYHAVTIARSRSLTSGFVGYEGNPILTHRHLGDMYPICNVGHADLVELQDGSWYIVALASRLYGGYHKNLGRETFIAPVDWSGDWPVVSPGTGKIEMSYPAPALPETPYTLPWDDTSFSSPIWNTLGTPVNNPVRIENDALYIRCEATPMLPIDRSGENTRVLHGAPVSALGFYGRRQQHMSLAFSATVRVPQNEAAGCGITVLQNAFNQLRLEVSRHGTGLHVRALKGTGISNEAFCTFYADALLGEAKFSGDLIRLRISAEGQHFILSAGGVQLAEADGGFMGSETAGGFVGAYVGMFATGNGTALADEARFTDVTYSHT